MRMINSDDHPRDSWNYIFLVWTTWMKTHTLRQNLKPASVWKSVSVNFWVCSHSVSSVNWIPKIGLQQILLLSFIFFHWTFRVFVWLVVCFHVTITCSWSLHLSVAGDRSSWRPMGHNQTHFHSHSRAPKNSNLPSQNKPTTCVCRHT